MRMTRVNLPLLLLAFSAGCLVVAGCGRDQQSARLPNILVVLVDALRADHLSGYGYDRPTSPFLDKFTEGGVTFTRAYAQASHTKLSVASLMTGLNPPSHHVRTSNWSDTAGNVTSDILSPQVRTLGEILQDAGYRTAGFVTNPHLQGFHGFDQGFDHYRYSDWHHIDAARLGAQATAWLVAQAKSPWFLYLHYMDVHSPYAPPAPWRYRYADRRIKLRPLNIMGPPERPVTPALVDHTVAMYDAQINYWDNEFKALIGDFRKRGWLEDTVVVVLSDHGEEFNEHGGFGHGYTVYDEMLHVPLIMVHDRGLPGPPLRNDTARVVDLLPTLCALAGVAQAVGATDGSDLFAAERLADPGEIPVYAEVSWASMPRTVRTTRHQLIFNKATAVWEFYDLADDPRQQRNRYREEDPIVRRLAKVLEELRLGSGRIDASGPIQLDDRTIEELKSLGYVK
jgi:arylsulfatase